MEGEGGEPKREAQVALNQSPEAVKEGGEDKSTLVLYWKKKTSNWPEWKTSASPSER